MNALLQEARTYIETMYAELNRPESDAKTRIAAITDEIEEKGSYTHTAEELNHGARMAWRNSNRCIGRLFWNQLDVIDARNCKTEAEVLEQLLLHISTAFHGGKIKPQITIFAPDANIRIWNHQLLRYAGYETDHGIIGDPASVPFTKACMKLGWKGQGTAFDILPLVVQLDEQEPMWMTIPEEVIPEVQLKHPHYSFIEDMQLKWYAVPIISDMRLEIGGISYQAAPFNGWYMGTEIGARNLADTDRYNLLPRIAEGMGLDTKRDAALWKDKALVELNIAVLESFREAGVTIVDHHTAAKQFMRFEQQEEKAGREVTGMWSWLIPPLSPATTHVFHKPYKNKIVTPNYFYQDAPYI